MQHTEILTIHDGFRINGPVGFSNVVCLRLEGEKILATFSENHSVVIDLADMKDQDASSFSLLLCWIRAAQKNKQTLSFLNIPNALQRMQKMFGLAEVSFS
jgi:ABC-type transporter Mla MlaB component